jgi:hypothetical protein
VGVERGCPQSDTGGEADDRFPIHGAGTGVCWPQPGAICWELGWGQCKVELSALR